MLFVMFVQNRHKCLNVALSDVVNERRYGNEQKIEKNEKNEENAG